MATKRSGIYQWCQNFPGFLPWALLVYRARVPCAGQAVDPRVAEHLGKVCWCDARTGHQEVLGHSQGHKGGHLAIDTGAPSAA